MLDNILNLVKETIADSISSNSNVPEDKQAATIETATHAVTNGLKDNFTLSNLSSLTSLFGGSGSVSNNSITNNIIGSVTSELIQKVGLSQSVANVISTTVVPLVMKVISGKVNDPNEKGINVESLIETFSGSSGHGLLSSISKLFGK